MANTDVNDSRNGQSYPDRVGNVSIPAGSVQVPATAGSVHTMLVAVIIMAAIGGMLVVIAGTSKEAGIIIAWILGIALLVQAITHVNPFVSWIVKHPLTPTQLATQNVQVTP